MAPQVHGWAGTRKLLRQLRDLLRDGGHWQQRLDRLVRLIADDMVAEVCSLYVMRAGEVLELFATHGLRPEAVHRTRLRLGEGIIGAVASTGRPLALSDAQLHPNFAYRPETGEEIFHSMLGVPVHRESRVIGILAIQNKTRRVYDEDEIEALETVAMVVAELIGGIGVIGQEEERHTDSISTLPNRLPGVIMSEGIGMGTAVLHHRGIVIRRVLAEDTAGELERFEHTLQAMLGALDDLFAGSDLARSGEHLEVLETYRMFAEDRGWLERIREAVRGGLTAEAAVQRALNDTRARLSKVRDPYIRERYVDLQDLGNRLMHHLLQSRGTAEARDLPEEMVLVARALGPAELLDYDRRRLRAVALEEGAPTAHVAIIARALGLPMIGRCRGLLQSLRPGDFMVVDGNTAQVMLRPRLSVRQSYDAAIETGARRRAGDVALRHLPAETRDGRRVHLLMNAGLAIDLHQMEACGAEGVGLYRTEVQFMIRNDFPDAVQQAEVYARAFDLCGELPITFRTLDVGGDKALPYWDGEREENPIMGWRAIRIGLDRPAMLRQQLRALLMAGRGRPLRVMFPMISDVAELDAARDLLEREVARHLAGGGARPRRIEVGVMLEVPALLWQLPTLFRHVDFLSVGSNDLFQFLFASDRGNARVARRYDVLSPAALTLLLSLAGDCEAAGVPLALCGEMAGHPIEAMALVGCGFRSLSMPPSSIPPVKTMIRSMSYQSLRDLTAFLAGQPARSVRPTLRAYARDHGILI